MSSSLPGGLKVVFLVHFAVALVFGLGYLLIPDQVGSIYGLRAEPPINDISRLLGAAMLGWALSSWMAFRALDRETVRIVVAAETVWTALSKGLSSCSRPLSPAPRSLRAGASSGS